MGFRCVIIVLAASFVFTDANNLCYSCGSAAVKNMGLNPAPLTFSDNCDDPFQASGIKQFDCPGSCFYTRFGPPGGKINTLRGCLSRMFSNEPPQPTECKFDGTTEQNMCWCNSNNCNNQTVPVPPKVTTTTGPVHKCYSCGSPILRIIKIPGYSNQPLSYSSNCNEPFKANNIATYDCPNACFMTRLKLGAFEVDIRGCASRMLGETQQYPQECHTYFFKPRYCYCNYDYCNAQQMPPRNATLLPSLPTTTPIPTSQTTKLTATNSNPTVSTPRTNINSTKSSSTANHVIPNSAVSVGVLAAIVLWISRMSL